MTITNRRAFFEDLGLGLLAAGSVALPGLRSLLEHEDEKRLHFGKLEPLVALLQETAPDDLLQLLVQKLKQGLDLKTLTAAGALANARTFGGEDYTGYHCAMAMLPAYEMGAAMKDPRFASLPLLKVLHRNSVRTAQRGGRKREVLRSVTAVDVPPTSESLLKAGRTQDVDAIETQFAAAKSLDPKAACDLLQPLMRDELDVHQVVLTWRSFDFQRVTGSEHAHVLLRQAMRQCVDRERSRIHNKRPEPAIRAVLPKLLQAHKFPSGIRGTHTPSDAEIEALAQTLFAGSSEAGAEAVASALDAGLGAEAVGEALSLASVRLILHDVGTRDAQAGKPAGSVHGASVGVHASDSALAWRGLVAVSNEPNALASLLAAGAHTAGQSRHLNREEPAHAAARSEAEKPEADQLIPAIDAAIRDRAQALATALVERYGKGNLPAAPLQQVLFDHALRADGALHHEKYFRTSIENFETARASTRWLHLMALARVTASGFGFEAPGLAEAESLLQRA